MRKVFLFIFLMITSVGMLNAQVSEVEASQQETKAEKFKEGVNFYKEMEIAHYWEEDVDIYAKVIIDMSNPSNKVAALEFRTNNRDNENVWTLLDGFSRGDKGSRSMGYIDLEEIGNLSRALNIILKEGKSPSKNEFFINYIFPGGLTVYYKYDKSFRDQKFFFRKVWNITNTYGTMVNVYVDSNKLGVKESMESLIKFLDESKQKLEEELAK